MELKLELDSKNCSARSRERLWFSCRNEDISVYILFSYFEVCVKDTQESKVKNYRIQTKEKRFIIKELEGNLLRYLAMY